MNKLIRKTLLASVSRCIVDLQKFHTRLNSVDGKKAAAIPGNINSEEYFTSSNELAGYLHCSRKTIDKYCSMGIFPYFIHQNSRVFRISDIDEIVENNPVCLAIKIAKNAQSEGKKAFTTTIKVISEKYMFVYLHFLSWTCTVCLSTGLLGNNVEISAICREIILLQNSVKPFPHLPNEN